MQHFITYSTITIAMHLTIGWCVTEHCELIFYHLIMYCRRKSLSQKFCDKTIDSVCSAFGNRALSSGHHIHVHLTYQCHEMRAKCAATNRLKKKSILQKKGEIKKKKKTLNCLNSYDYLF